MRSIKLQRTSPSIIDFNYFVCKNNLKWIRLLSKLAKNKKEILDIGCGNKPFQSFFKKQNYIGIDFTLEDTKTDFKVDLNTEKLPFPNSSFDIIILSEVMEHIVNNENLISEIKRVLRKKGYLFISSPFTFPEHGKPYDFFRFTQYYYEQTFKEMKLVSKSRSNSFFVMPFIYINYIFGTLSSIPYTTVLFYLLIFVNNLYIYCLDYIISSIKIKKFISAAEIGTAGYYYLYEK